MNGQVQTIYIDVEELAAPRHISDRQPTERGHRWIVGLQNGDPGDVDAGHHASNEPLAEKPCERLHLG